MSDFTTLSVPADATPADKVRAACNALGLTIRAEFVPFSKSRNAKPRDGQDKPWRSLNWNITLERNGRDVMTTEYSAGEGNCPASKLPATALRRAQYTDATARRMAVDHEIETGREARFTFGGYLKQNGPQIQPDAPSVIMSLVLDSSVLDAGSFEDWAAEYGYDTDSRSAERTYQACLKTALKLRAAIGEVGLELLRAAGEDF
jgi:hypothetical protein